MGDTRLVIGIIIGIIVLIIGTVIAKKGYDAGKLEEQLPLSKILIYVAVLIFTLYDMFKNIKTITWGLSVAVAMSAIFEIMSNIFIVKNHKK